MVRYSSKFPEKFLDNELHGYIILYISNACQFEFWTFLKSLTMAITNTRLLHCVVCILIEATKQSTRIQNCQFVFWTLLKTLDNELHEYVIRICYTHWLSFLYSELSKKKKKKKNQKKKKKKKKKRLTMCMWSLLIYWNPNNYTKQKHKTAEFRLIIVTGKGLAEILMILITFSILSILITFVIMFKSSQHITFMQRRINVDATSWRCIDVDATLSQRCDPAGLIVYICVYVKF